MSLIDPGKCPHPVLRCRLDGTQEVMIPPTGAIITFGLVTCGGCGGSFMVPAIEPLRHVAAPTPRNARPKPTTTTP